MTPLETILDTEITTNEFAKLAPTIDFLLPEDVKKKIIQLDAVGRYSLQDILKRGLLTQDMITNRDVVRNADNQYLGLNIIEYFLQRAWYLSFEEKQFANSIERETLADYFGVPIITLNQAIAVLESKVASDNDNKQQQRAAIPFLDVFRSEDESEKSILLSGNVKRRYIADIGLLLPTIKDAKPELKAVPELPAHDIIPPPIPFLPPPASSLLQQQQEEPPKGNRRLPSFYREKDPFITLDQRRKDADDHRNAVAAWIASNPTDYNDHLEKARAHAEARREKYGKKGVSDENTGKLKDSRDVKRNSDVPKDDALEADMALMHVPKYRLKVERYTSSTKPPEMTRYELLQPLHWFIHFADPDCPEDLNRPANRLFNEIREFVRDPDMDVYYAQVLAPTIKALGTDTEIVYTPLDLEFVLNYGGEMITINPDGTRNFPPINLNISRNNSWKLAKALIECSRFNPLITSDHEASDPLSALDYELVRKSSLLSSGDKRRNKKKLEPILEQMVKCSMIKKISVIINRRGILRPEDFYLMPRAAVEYFEDAKDILDAEKQVVFFDDPLIQEAQEAMLDVQHVEYITLDKLAEVIGLQRNPSFRSKIGKVASLCNPGEAHYKAGLYPITKRMADAINTVFADEFASHGKQPITIQELYRAVGAKAPHKLPNFLKSYDSDSVAAMEHKRIKGHGRRDARLKLPERIAKRAYYNVKTNHLESEGKTPMSTATSQSKTRCNKRQFADEFLFLLRREFDYTVPESEAYTTISLLLDHEKITKKDRTRIIELIIFDSMPFYVGTTRYLNPNSLKASIEYNLAGYRTTGEWGALGEKVVQGLFGTPLANTSASAASPPDLEKDNRRVHYFADEDDATSTSELNESEIVTTMTHKDMLTLEIRMKREQKYHDELRRNTPHTFPNKIAAENHLYDWMLITDLSYVQTKRIINTVLGEFVDNNIDSKQLEIKVSTKYAEFCRTKSR